MYCINTHCRSCFQLPELSFCGMQMTKCRDSYFSYVPAWDFMIAQIIREISDRPKIIVVADDVGKDVPAHALECNEEVV